MRHAQEKTCKIDGECRFALKFDEKRRLTQNLYANTYRRVIKTNLYCQTDLIIMICIYCIVYYICIFIYNDCKH